MNVARLGTCVVPAHDSEGACVVRRSVRLCSDHGFVVSTLDGACSTGLAIIGLACGRSDGSSGTLTRTGGDSAGTIAVVRTGAGNDGTPEVVGTGGGDDMLAAFVRTGGGNDGALAVVLGTRGGSDDALVRVGGGNDGRVTRSRIGVSSELSSFATGAVGCGSGGIDDGRAAGAVIIRTGLICACSRVPCGARDRGSGSTAPLPRIGGTVADIRADFFFFLVGGLNIRSSSSLTPGPWVETRLISSLTAVDSFLGFAIGDGELRTALIQASRKAGVPDALKTCAGAISQYL